MNDAVQIRRCSGALRANHFRFQPSFPPPPPAHRSNLKISNRESLRLEIPVTHTKQTIRYHSNREFETLFQVTASTRRGRPFVPFSDAPPGFLPRAKPRGRPSFRPSFLPPSPLRRRQPAVPTSDYQPQNPNLHRAKRARHRNAHPPFL
jgi:hypothetical protein